MSLFENKLDLCSINCCIFAMIGNCSAILRVLANSLLAVSPMEKIRLKGLTLPPQLSGGVKQKISFLH